MTGPTYDEVLKLIQRIPRPPRLEFHCHPVVMVALRAFTAGKEPVPRLFSHDLANIPVIEHEDYLKGFWELSRDGVIVDYGFITIPPEEAP